MSDLIDSINDIVRAHDRWANAARARNEDSQAEMWEARAAVLRSAVQELENLRRITKPIPASYGDLSDLPPELIKELSGIKVDDLEQQIYTIIKSGGGDVDLDAVLIELFRRFKVVQTRRFLQNKLWRMAQKGLIYSVTGKKGIYSADAVSASSGASPNAVATNSSWDTDLDDDMPF